jgi:hypothetical protein
MQRKEKQVEKKGRKSLFKVKKAMGQEIDKFFSLGNVFNLKRPPKLILVVELRK